MLGRLESSNEFKSENKIETDSNNDVDILELKISVRNLNEDDILTRKLPKNTTGVVVTNKSQELQIQCFVISILQLDKTDNLPESLEFFFAIILLATSF